MEQGGTFSKESFWAQNSLTECKKHTIKNTLMSQLGQPNHKENASVKKNVDVSAGVMVPADTEATWALNLCPVSEAMFATLSSHVIMYKWNLSLEIENQVNILKLNPCIQILIMISVGQNSS